MDLDGAHISTPDELVDDLLEHMLLKFDGNGAAHRVVEQFGETAKLLNDSNVSSEFAWMFIFCLTDMIEHQ